jgi:hypothetical protein
MFELKKYYSASTGGTQNISSILNMINKAVYNNHDLNGHISYMNSLYDICDGMECPQTDSMKLLYLRESILRGNKRVFENTINFYKHLPNTTYYDFINALQVDNSNELLKRDESKITKEFMPNIKALTTTCKHCGKEGHQPVGK